MLSIFGSSIFSSFNRFFSLFGLFKAARVFRIGPMIAKSNVDERTKATLNLFKLIFYLFFYLHTLACYMWLCIDLNSPKRYYREYDNGYYISFDGEILKDEQGNNVPIDDNFYVLFGEPMTFKDYEWNRFTPEDSPNWEALNAAWEERPSQWYMPLDWVNFVDQ